MKYYAIVCIHLDTDTTLVWEKIYRTEHDAAIALGALIHSNFIEDGYVMPVELVIV